MKLSTISFLKNQKGVSLISVLVASGLLAVLGLTFASMLKSTGDVQTLLKKRDEADNAKMIAAAYLRNADICKKSLLGDSGVKLNKIESKSGHEIVSIVTPSGDKVLDTKLPSGPTDLIVEPINQNKSAARISSSSYMAQLRIRFTSENNTGGGIADRILPVQLTLTGGTATACRVAGGDSDDSNDEDLELARSGPHMNKGNCLGQYFPITGSRSPASVYDAKGLKPVDAATRLKLVAKVPPQLVLNGLPPSRVDKRGLGYVMLDDRMSVFSKKLSSEIITLGHYGREELIPKPAEKGMIQEIDGVKYFITPTFMKGTSWGKGPDSTGCGSSYVCEGSSGNGIAEKNFQGRNCAGGNR